MTQDNTKQSKTLQQLSRLIAHETDERRMSDLISELQAILQTEQTEIGKRFEATTGMASKLA